MFAKKVTKIIDEELNFQLESKNRIFLKLNLECLKI